MRRCALLLGSLASCVLPSSGDEDDTRSGFHDVTVGWRLMNLDGSVMTSCPPGFTNLVTHLYVDGYVEPPDALIETPCTPQGSLTQPVATGGRLLDPEAEAEGYNAYFPYSPIKDIWIDLTEETRTAYAARSYLYHLENLASDKTIEFDIYPEGGVGVLAWTLISSLTSAPLSSCAAASVDEIEVAVRPWSDDTAPLQVIGTWPCDAVDPYFYYDPNANTTLLDEQYELGSGHTRAVAPGEYFVELRAKRGGSIVGTADSSVITGSENDAERILDSEIPVTDR